MNHMAITSVVSRTSFHPQYASGFRCAKERIPGALGSDAMDSNQLHAIHLSLFKDLYVGDKHPNFEVGRGAAEAAFLGSVPRFGAMS